MYKRKALEVAPARERGLKFMYLGEFDDKTCGRSRKGAWIEITPTVERCSRLAVAPARERGLKYSLIKPLLKNVRSLPQGSVD